MRLGHYPNRHWSLTFQPILQFNPVGNVGPDCRTVGLGEGIFHIVL